MKALIHNAQISTQDGDYSWMIIENGIIQNLGHGTLPDIENRVDMRQRLILPGLHDSHIHVYSLGRMSTRLHLHGTGSIVEMLYKLKEFREENPDQEWIIGHGWDQDLMEDGRYPSKHDLDTISPDLPVLLYRACNHIGVVNSKALEIMGITTNTPDPQGGQIDHFEDGDVTGVLREAGLSLVAPHISHLDDALRLEYYRRGVQICVEKGLTAVHTNDGQAWEYYKKLADNDELPLRVFLTHKYSDLDKGVPPVNESHGLLTAKRVKLFSDGSLGAETAALRENYDGSDQKGLLIDQPEILATKIARIHQMGYQLEVHAIGDYAAEVVMDGFQKAGITAADRAIITHCQILARDLVDRMVQNGYIANIQPPFVPTDARWAEKRLGGGERLDYAYAWKTLINAGVIAAGGSDAPIEDADPFWGLYCALFHPDPMGETWKEHERLSWEEALRIYTENGAFAVGEERHLGKLKEGYKADFVVVNPALLDNFELLKEKPLHQVWVDGKLRHTSE
ncbi:MAG: amidohydrolase [Candidatus Kariarchaeaceae archaeon]|jgi:predicted amidohydrolase YtcJ